MQVMDIKHTSEQENSCDDVIWYLSATALHSNCAWKSMREEYYIPLYNGLQFELSERPYVVVLAQMEMTLLQGGFS